MLWLNNCLNNWNCLSSHLENQIKHYLEHNRTLNSVNGLAVNTRHKYNTQKVTSYCKPEYSRTHQRHFQEMYCTFSKQNEYILDIQMSAYKAWWDPKHIKHTWRRFHTLLVYLSVLVVWKTLQKLYSRNFCKKWARMNRLRKNISDTTAQNIKLFVKKLIKRLKN